MYLVCAYLVKDRDKNDMMSSSFSYVYNGQSTILYLKILVRHIHVTLVILLELRRHLMT